MVAAIPELPRRVTASDFITQQLPQLIQAFKPEADLDLPFAFNIEIEIEGEVAAVYTLHTKKNGDVAAYFGESQQTPEMCIVMDDSGFQALYSMLYQWLRLRRKNKDSTEVSMWLDSYFQRWHENLLAIKHTVESHPATIEFLFRDELEQEHLVTAELGEPGEHSPYIRLRFALDDIPMDIHHKEQAAIEALMQAKVRITGDADYFTHFVKYFR